MATIDGENGLWTLDRRGDYPTYGQRETGLCQFHPRYNSHIINDPRFSDYRFQVEQCWEKFSANPNLFNAYKNGLYKKQKKHFTLTEK